MNQDDARVEVVRTSFAEDFGVALKSGAYLSELCRIEIGDYSLENAYNLQEIEKKIK